MFVLPRPVASPFSSHVRLIAQRPADPANPVAEPPPVTATEFRLDEFEHVTFRTIDSQIANPYQSQDEYLRELPDPAQPVSTRVVERTQKHLVSWGRRAIASAPASTGWRRGAARDDRV